MQTILYNVGSKPADTICYSADKVRMTQDLAPSPNWLLCCLITKVHFCLFASVHEYSFLIRGANVQAKLY